MIKQEQKEKQQQLQAKLAEMESRKIAQVRNVFFFFLSIYKILLFT